MEKSEDITKCYADNFIKKVIARHQIIYLILQSLNPGQELIPADSIRHLDIPNLSSLLHYDALQGYQSNICEYLG